MRNYSNEKLISKYNRKISSSFYDGGFKKRLKDDDRFKDIDFKRIVPRILYKKSNVLNPLSEVHKKYKVVIEYVEGEEITNSLIYHITNFCIKCNLENPPPFTISKVKYYLVDQNPLDGVILKGKPTVCTVKGTNSDDIVPNIYYNGETADADTKKIKINDGEIYYKLNEGKKKIAICSYTNSFNESIKLTVESPNTTSVVPNINLAAGGYYNYESSLSNGRYEVINFISNKDIQVFGDSDEKYKKLIPNKGFIVYDVVISDIDITNFAEFSKIVAKTDFFTLKFESAIKMLPELNEYNVYKELLDDHRGKAGGIFNILNSIDSIVSKTIQFTSNFIKLFIEGSGYNIIYNYKNAINYFKEDFYNQTQRYMEYMYNKLIELAHKTRLESRQASFGSFLCFTDPKLNIFEQNKYIKLWGKIKGGFTSTRDLHECLQFVHRFVALIYPKVKSNYESTTEKFVELENKSIEIFTTIKEIIFTYFNTKKIKSRVYEMLMKGINTNKLNEILSIQRNKTSIEQKSKDYAANYTKIYNNFTTIYNNSLTTNHIYILKISEAILNSVNNNVGVAVNPPRQVLILDERNQMEIEAPRERAFEEEQEEPDNVEMSVEQDIREDQINETSEENDGLDDETESDTYVKGSIGKKIFGIHKYITTLKSSRYSNTYTLEQVTDLLENSEDFILKCTERLEIFVKKYERMYSFLRSVNFRQTIESYSNFITRNNHEYCHVKYRDYISVFSVGMMQRMIKMYDYFYSANEYDHLDLIIGINRIIFTGFMYTGDEKYKEHTIILHRFCPLANFDGWKAAIEDYLALLVIIYKNTFSSTNCPQGEEYVKCDLIGETFHIENSTKVEDSYYLKKINIKSVADFVYDLFYLKTIRNESINFDFLKKNYCFLHTTDYKFFDDETVIGNKVIWVNSDIETKWRINISVSPKRYLKYEKHIAYRLIYFHICSLVMHGLTKAISKPEIMYSITPTGVNNGYTMGALYYIVQLNHTIENLYERIIESDVKKSALDVIRSSVYVVENQKKQKISKNIP